MSFDKFIERLCTDTAVYWGNPQNNGYGGYTYDEPVEINCRWNKETELLSDDNGNTIVSNAQILVTPNMTLDEESMVYLGTLDNLDSGQQDNPESIKKSWKVKRFRSITNIKGNTSVKKAFL